MLRQMNSLFLRLSFQVKVTSVHFPVRIIVYYFERAFVLINYIIVDLIMSAIDLGAANVTSGTPTLTDITVLSSKVSIRSRIYTVLSFWLL